LWGDEEPDHETTKGKVSETFTRKRGNVVKKRKKRRRTKKAGEREAVSREENRERNNQTKRESPGGTEPTAGKTHRGDRLKKGSLTPS